MFAIQSITSIALGQPSWVGLLALVGMKPALEAWRDATGEDAFKGQKVGSDFMIWICRMVEMVTETIPQAFIQVVALLMTPTIERRAIQYASLSITIAFTDRTLDKDKRRRLVDPHLFGYVPTTNGQYWQLLHMVLFFATYVAAKMFSLSLLLMMCGISVAGGWLLTEFGLLLLVRVAMRNWRVYRRGADGAGFGVLVHLALYIGLLAAPFPLIRMPTFLTSRVYSGGLLYIMLVNFAQGGISYRCSDVRTID